MRLANSGTHSHAPRREAKPVSSMRKLSMAVELVPYASIDRSRGIIMNVQHIDDNGRTAHLPLAAGMPLSAASAGASKRPAFGSSSVAWLQLESGGDVSAYNRLGGRPPCYCFHPGAQPALCCRRTAERAIGCRLQLGYPAALGVLCAAAPPDAAAGPEVAHGSVPSWC